MTTITLRGKREFNGTPTPAGDIGHPPAPPPGPGHTNSAQGLGTRRTVTLQSHFPVPEGLKTSEISKAFWETFIKSTAERYRRGAPDLNDVKAAGMRHPMVPNTAIPVDGDDLNFVSPGDTFDRTPVPQVRSTQWPNQGPVASSDGPAAEQNPKIMSTNLDRNNYRLYSARKDRYPEE